MSKIGKMPITLPAGVTVQQQNNVVTVSGSKGNFSYNLPESVMVKNEDGKITVTQKIPNDIHSRAIYGLTRANLANLVKGVSDGFEKSLELTGVGYRAQASGSQLTLSVGYSHPVIIKASDGITFAVKENIITVSGADKVAVGEIAAKVRAVKPPEPYKGKGIKYVGEYIRRKAGKAAKAVGGGAK